jgi:hypothetical protein
MRVQVKIHDVAEARRLAGPDFRRLPVLRYTDGTCHLLLPSGQRVNVQKKIHGKHARRLRIKNVRFMRENTGAVASAGIQSS